jgi:hypothetical protein
MMNNPYDLHSWSKQYREDALQEAHERHLAKQVKAHRKQRSEQSRVGLAWSSVMTLVHGALSSE